MIAILLGTFKGGEGILQLLIRTIVEGTSDSGLSKSPKLHMLGNKSSSKPDK